jgi:1-acyl-sn-glycerol-3-phosphate acyltransferase
LRAAVVDRVVAALGIPPDSVVIAEPGAVLKTSSGKIRRGATREAYLSGALGRGRRSAWIQWTRLILEGWRAQLRRLGSRCGSLVFAGYLATVLAFVLLPLWGLLLILPGGRSVDRLVRAACRALLALGGYPLRVEGPGNLLGTAPAVLVSNHSSYLDAVALLAALPVDFRFIGKRELAPVPLIGTVIRKAGHLTVERADLSRSAADAERATRMLMGGVSLLFFPEGTFTLAPGVLPFRLGAFKAAVEAGRPVIPVTIRGTREILPSERWLPKPGAITVRISAPLKPEGSGWPEMVRLRDLARAEIARRSGERLTGAVLAPPATPERKAS